MNRRDFLRHSSLALAVAAILGSRPRELLAATSGRAYYLDSDTGNDDASGNSPQQAWRSLEKLNSIRFQPGDRIYFKRGGSFPGQFQPQGSGTAEQPITVDCYGSGELPHILAHGEVQCSLYLHNVEYWTLRNLQVSNQGARAQGYRAGIYVHHENFGVARGIVLDGLHVHDVNGSPIKRQGAGAGIMVNATGTWRPSRYDGLLISRCSIVNTQRNGIHFLAGGSREGGLGCNVIVRGNTIQQVPGDCILMIGCDGALVEHNTVSDCTELPPGEAAAGIWPFNCDNTLIQYNEVSGHRAHADGQAYDVDLGCSNTIIQYNYSHDNVGGLVLICNEGQSDLPVGNVGTIVRYNVSINDALRLSGGASLRVTGPVDGSKVSNNIFIIPRRPGGHAGTIFKADDWQGVPRNIDIHDNIIIAELAPDVEFGLASQSMVTGNPVWGTSDSVNLSQGAGLTGKSINRSTQAHLLERYQSYRPSLAEVVQLAKQCFANGKVAPDAYELVLRTAHAS